MPNCKECKNAKIVIGFEDDPICTIDKGVECARKKTWNFYEFNNNRVNFVEGGLEAMVKEFKDCLNIK